MSEHLKYKHGWYVMPVAGHSQVLTYRVGPSMCGHITNGVSFQFGNDGALVIDFDDIKELVRLAHESRAQVPK
jgi:hypothetical protein